MDSGDVYQPKRNVFTGTKNNNISGTLVSGKNGKRCDSPSSLFTLRNEINREINTVFNCKGVLGKEGLLERFYRQKNL